MRKSLLFILIIFSCGVLFGQTAQPPIAPQSKPELPKNPPIVTFTLDWPQAIPPFYSVAIESDGNVAYQSTPQANNQGDPYILKFLASDDTRTQVFDLAKQVNFFHGDFEYKKARIAFTGTKTLKFQNGSDIRQTSFNWSENPQIQQLTTIFQRISETIELGRTLADKYRYDKLGLNEILEQMVNAEKGNQLAELQAIQPILSQVARDPGVMNIARRRAQYLLGKVPPSASPAAAAASSSQR